MDKQTSDILASVDELANRGKITRSKAFAAWYAINFFSVDEDDALESAAAADGGNDQGVDIVFADESSQEIIVIQAYCPENISKITPKSKWDQIIGSVPFVESPSQFISSGRPDLAEIIYDLRSINPDYTTSFGLISLGKRSDAIETSLKAHKNGSLKHYNFFYMSQEDILSDYKALVDEDAGIAEDTFQFSGKLFEDSGEYGRSWIGSVSATELRRLFTAHKTRLFAGNVRLFLGARKGGINEQIIKTAKETPGTFWALNNGITIVADSASISDDNSGTTTLRLKRFSIVNGCQTTSSLVEAGASDAKVLARVIAAKFGLKNEIVRYNNSQNAVKIWTVRAVDTIQERLRKEFQYCGINYAPKMEGSRKKRNSSIIELDKVTQFLASGENQFILQAIDNKSELFDQPYQKIYKKGIKATAVYLAWLVGSAADTERLNCMRVWVRTKTRDFFLLRVITG